MHLQIQKTNFYIGLILDVDILCVYDLNVDNFSENDRLIYFYKQLCLLLLK